MAYCVKCGEKVEDTVMTCPACGAAIPRPEPAGQGSGYTYTESAQSRSGGYAYGSTQSQNGGYAYGSTQSQNGGYAYGSTQSQNGGYAYGSTQSQNGGYAYGNTQSQGSGQNTYRSYHDVQAREGYFPEAEIRSNKLMAVLCYIGVLVFIPLLAGNRESEYLKLHKNQGLILFAVDAFLDILEKGWGWSAGLFSWFTGGLFGNVCDIIRIVILILWIMGIVRACKGVREELPVIGKIKLFR